MFSLNKDLQEIKINFAIFIKELKLDLIQDKLEDYFENNKEEILNIKQKINKTDKEINQLVYKLYGLTEEEIGKIEALC